MRAMVFRSFGGPEVLELAEVPTPEPGAGEVLVRVRAASINRLDIEFRQTGFGFAGPDFPFPHVGGADAAGVVEEVGEGVTSVRPGDRVVVFTFVTCGQCPACLARRPENMCQNYQLLGIHRWGGYAEYVCVPERNVVPLPDEVGFEAASCLPVSYVTAWHGLVNRADVGPGDRVVVMGATSSTGIAAVQIAALRGARVVGVGRSGGKLARLSEVGAEGAVSLLEERWPQRVCEILGGRATVLFDTLGTTTWAHVSALLDRGARVAVCGRSSGTELSTNLLWLYRNVTTVFFYLSGQRRDLEALVAATSRGSLRPVVHRVYPLEELPAAQRAVDGGEPFGKVVVRV
ncbi:alcohol dehydrogenase catalytic domain-containing protein [Thermomicrobium sp. CFH 73360]|uniref:alcohol dehydrogenase catalytic domain-containing protein n=1 Tax=Thermomicrobium sp. CFH 73360 TaxID=2951987 RepID=UPI0020775F73|nr:alcohol dehydrogenase catalytic domain-containing protein [Thermomicrobium sp. CFH 73360]MCM8746538.1 alcohol dehydrogenase catalytic domain-containing protein [Thermomicrobium sp. CFH 73360]